jgi:hypothetical protein
MTLERIPFSSVCAKRSSGEGPQSYTSRGIRSSSDSTGSSSEIWFGRRFRNFMSAWFYAMRTSKV